MVRLKGQRLDPMALEKLSLFEVPARTDAAVNNK